MLKDCPADLKQRRCYIRFVRGANELKTKASAVDDGGYAEFNEKIDMKTFIEYDQAAGKYRSKMARMEACLEGG